MANPYDATPLGGKLTGGAGLGACKAGSCWNRQRSDLLAWLQRNAPSLSELYEGSVVLMYERPLPGLTRFVAHAVREIRNRLPEAVFATKSRRLDYVTELDRIAQEWRSFGLPMDGSLPAAAFSGAIPSEATQGIVLPKGACKKISQLISVHEMTREKPVEAAVRLFAGIPDQSQAQTDSLRPVALQWVQITNWFVGKAHDGGRTDSELLDGEFRNKFELFELTLASLITRFFETTKEIDAILEETNS